MGYINQNSKGQRLPATGKAKALIQDGAIVIPTPRVRIPNLVCVVENGLFDAALYVDNDNDFKRVIDPHDDRPMTYLIYEHAAKLGVD